jgi:hypothetical protein
MIDMSALNEAVIALYKTNIITDGLVYFHGEVHGNTQAATDSKRIDSNDRLSRL